MAQQILVIDSIAYDISNFSHPGGNIISYMSGRDATGPFREFHYRSSVKVNSVLDSLPRIELQANSLKAERLDDEEILKDFYRWRRDLEKRGYFEPSYSHIALRVMELILIFGLACYFASRNVVVSVLLLTLFGGKCGWIQHEGGHLSLTGRKKIDHFIQDIFIGWGLAADSSLWNTKHNKHHATPQKVNHDYDIDQIPLAAFFDTAVETSRMQLKLSPVLRLWLKFQVYSYLPISCGVGYFLLLSYHFKSIRRQKNFFQLCIVVSSVLLRLGLFYYVGQCTLAESLGLLLLNFWGVGMYLSGHFFLSHSFEPIVQVDENPSWVRYAIEHTVDIDPQNPLVNWIMGYLNCQVIHHLFPSMPQFRQQEVSIELQKKVKEWGMNYKIVGYFEAWRGVFDNLSNVGAHYYDLPLQ